MKMPIIKKYRFQFDEGHSFIDELCKQMKMANYKQPLIEDDK